MKVIPAAVAALVIGASLLTAAPSTAATASTAASTALSTTPSSTVLTDALPGITDAPSVDSALPPHPLVIPPSAGASAQSAPSESVEAAGTATISGTVTFVGRGALAGIPVTAYTFTDSGAIATVNSVDSGDDGSFSITGLPAATYWVAYDDEADSQNPSFQWWGASRLHPYGTEIELADGESFTASWELQATGGVKGTLTCTTCSSAPDPKTVVIRVGAWDADAGFYRFVDGGRPSADGSYAFDSLYPGSGYVMFAIYSGTGPFIQTSGSPEFTVNVGGSASQNVIQAYKLTPVPGIVRSVDSDVNALYYDYLTRLPTSSDVSFWGKLIQSGANPNIVASGFVTSDEYRYIRIDAAYRSILGREPEAAGRLNWLTGMKGGVLTTDDIETAFYASTEYYNRNGGTDKAFMKAVYSTLLGRGGTDSDYTFWAKAVQQHGRAWVVNQFWITPETIQKRVSNMYELYLGRVPDAGGLAAWVGVALQIGDSGLRAGLTGSEEYFIRSQYRFSERTD